MKFKINPSIIFILFTLYSFSLSNNIDTIRNLYNSGKPCIGEDIYSQIVNDSNAVKYYVQKICSGKTGFDARNYIYNTYGTKTQTLGSGSFGEVSKFTKNDKSFAIKIAKNFKYKDVFKELNASECIKQNLGDVPEINFIVSISYPAQAKLH